MLWGTCSAAACVKYVSVFLIVQRSGLLNLLGCIVLTNNLRRKCDHYQEPFYNDPVCVEWPPPPPPPPHRNSTRGNYSRLLRDASWCCYRPAELVARLLLQLLCGEDETLFHWELRDLSGGNLSTVSLLNAMCSRPSICAKKRKNICVMLNDARIWHSQFGQKQFMLSFKPHYSMWLQWWDMTKTCGFPIMTWREGNDSTAAESASAGRALWVRAVSCRE